MFKVFIVAFIGLASNFFSATSSFGANEKSCGVNQRCQDGYYCAGAIGESASGVCVANSVNILMCRAIEYIQSDVLKYIFLFAGVFGGILMFVGTFTLKAFAQITIGIGMLLGAQQIVVNISGSNKGFCSPSGALNYLQTIKTRNVIHNDKSIRNLNYESNKYYSCSTLECSLYECQNYKIEPDSTDKTKNICSIVAGKSEFYLQNGFDSQQSECLPDTICQNPTSTQEVEDETCQKDFKIQCTIKLGTYIRDYFSCSYSSNEAFAVEVPASWKLKTCLDVVNKNGK